MKRPGGILRYCKCVYLLLFLDLGRNHKPWSFWLNFFFSQAVCSIKCSLSGTVCCRLEQNSLITLYIVSLNLIHITFLFILLIIKMVLIWFLSGVGGQSIWSKSLYWHWWKLPHIPVFQKKGKFRTSWYNCPLKNHFQSEWDLHRETDETFSISTPMADHKDNNWYYMFFEGLSWCEIGPATALDGIMYPYCLINQLFL